MDEPEQGSAHKYLTVRDHLAALVAQELQVGDAIPSERHLSQQFGLSRMTVRQAVDTLVTDGVLVREQGRGTFVAPQRMDFEMRLTTFGEEMRRRGMEPATTVLAAQVVAATPDVATALELEPRQKVHFLYRVRSADGVPICIEQAWVPVVAGAHALRRRPPGEHVRGAAGARAGPRVGRGHAVRRRGHRHRGVPARARRRPRRAARRAPHLLGRQPRRCSPAPATAPTATACGSRCARRGPRWSPDDAPTVDARARRHTHRRRTAMRPQSRDQAAAILAALGGVDNIDEIEPCTTRLRSLVRDASRVDAAGLRAAGRVRRDDLRTRGAGGGGAARRPHRHRPRRADVRSRT